MTRVLIVDNYDSFTWNLAQLFGSLRCEVVVRRNDAVDIARAEELRPTHLVISPGPGHPRDSAASLDLLRHFASRLPVLGVCLGHQAIGMLHGGTVGHADRLMHGKLSPVYHDGAGIFRGLPNPFRATRYHSLVVREEGLPTDLEISAHTSDGEIMGLRVRSLRVDGVQFHPESVASEAGLDLARNFLESSP